VAIIVEKNTSIKAALETLHHSWSSANMQFKQDPDGFAATKASLEAELQNVQQMWDQLDNDYISDIRAMR
jgi:hypothetical protein